MKKLIEALHVIQEECNKYPNSCTYECPFYHKDRGCLILQKPNFWQINDEVKKALL